MKTKKTTLAAFALLVSAAARAQAPPPAPPRVTGAVETSILELDVVVTDKGGRPVSGLGRDDFEVKIGGKPVAIENFYERRTLPAPASEDSGTPATAPAGAAATLSPAPRQPRHIVLFVDRLHLIEKWKADAAFDALRELIRKTVVGPGDDAMIVTWDRAIGTVIPFTADLSAIDRVLAREQRLSRSPLPEDMTVRSLQDEAAWFATLPTSSVSSGVEVSTRAAAAEAYAQMQAKASALKGVFSTLGGLPGRKVVVLVSHRFSELAGLEFSLTGPVRYGEFSPDAREFNARGIVDSVARAANANGITVYTFFPTGWPDEAAVVRADASRYSNPKLDSPVEGARGDMIVQNEAAAQEPLALETGGTFTLGYKDAPTLSARIVADVESSYSLGVAAPGGKPGRTLSVDVKTRDRSLRVRSRRTAVERTPEERIEARVLSNLFRAESPSGLRVAFESASVDTKKGKTTAALKVRVPIAGLVRTPSARGESGAFSVLVASADANGSFTEVVRQRRPFEIPKGDAERAAAGHFTYEVPVVIGSGEARISVCVWDEVGKDAGFLLVELRDGRASVRR